VPTVAPVIAPDELPLTVNAVALVAVSVMVSTLGVKFRYAESVPLPVPA
jgi:hypothetical protein